MTSVRLESSPPVSRMIVFLWQHQNTGLGMPMTVWCQGNVDGSYYVDWDLATILAGGETGGDVSRMAMQMFANLLLAARGKFREVTKDEADRIAIAAYPVERVGVTLQ